MIKRVIEKSIRKFKNPNFTFDENLKNSMLISLFFEKIISLVRALKLIIFFQKPKLLFLGKNVVFKNISNIELGKGIYLDDYVYLNGLGKGNIIIGNNCRIGAYSRLIISTTYNNLGEYIHIGNNVGMGEFCRIGGSGGVSIGDNTIIAQYLSLHPENHNFSDTSKLIKEQGTTRKAINIGENCWIGAKVTVLAGVTIGNNCIIAAGSVVNKSMPDNSIIGGVPAKIIKMRE